MSLFRFRIAWDEDDNIYRDIIVKSGQSFDTFQTAILNAFEFKDKKPASFFESNERWSKGRQISSEVLTNKRNAPALSMIKTPVSALVDQPDKRFLFEYDPDKQWLFRLMLISLAKDDDQTYPKMVKSEGLAPHKMFADNSLIKDASEGMEDQYDADGEDRDEDGFETEDNDGFDDENGTDSDADTDDFNMDEDDF